MLLTKSSLIALWLMVVSVIMITLPLGALGAACMSLVADGVRALSSAISAFFGFIIGVGLGPLAAGALSDLFHPWAGDQSLRYALLWMCPGYLWASFHMWAASRTILQDLQAARAQAQFGPELTNDYVGLAFGRIAPNALSEMKEKRSSAS
jgi:hypothetical protein